MRRSSSDPPDRSRRPVAAPRPPLDPGQPTTSTRPGRLPPPARRPRRRRAEPARSDRSAAAESAVTGGSGRVRHDEKITVYVSREELLAIEQARLRLRGEFGLAVDRGRLVRAAMALALADLDASGADGELVRRLTAS